MSAPRLHPFARLVLAAIGVFISSSIVQAVGLLALLLFSKQSGVANLALPALTDRIQQLAQNYGLPLTVLSYPIALAVLFGVRTHVDFYSWRSLGFSRLRALPNFARGALTALLTLSVLSSLMWLTGAIRFGGWSSDVQHHSALYSIGALLIFGVGFGAVGLSEETLFRGYGLANLYQWLGWRGAVAVQAIVFAGIHLGNGIGHPDVLRSAPMAMPNIALIAVFFALSYRKTGSLWFPIGFHIAWDWLLGCVFSLPVSGIPTFHLFGVQSIGPSILTGGAFGAEASILLIPLVLAMIYAMSLAPDHPRAMGNLNAPESTRATDYVPVSAPLAPPVALSAPIDVAEEPEEARVNRYGARFGSAQGFDSETLRELKQMQDARDEAQRQRDEAIRATRREEELRLEEVRRAQIAAQTQVMAVETSDAPILVEEDDSEAPTAVATRVETPMSVVAQAATVETQPLPVEAPAEVAPSPRPSLEPRRASLESRRPSLEPRRQSASPPVETPEKPAAPPTEPTDAPPKKVRPRW